MIDRPISASAAAAEPLQARPTPANPHPLRLTASGTGTTLGAAALFFAAWRLGQPALAVPALAGILVFGVALWQAAPPRTLAADRGVAPSRVVRGEPALGKLTVRNAARPLRTGIAATDHCQGSPIELWLPALRRNEARTVTYPLPTMRRGVVRLGPLLLTRRDMFGLLQRVIPCGRPATVLVRPRTIALPMLPAGRARHLEGPTSETAAEGSVAFHSLRDYVPGDDLRRVHWPSTARTGSLVMRKMVDASWPRTIVLLDLRPSAYQDPESAELAVDCAASVALSAATRNFPVTVRTSSGTHRDVLGTDDVLDWLALAAADDAGSFNDELRLLRQMSGAGALVVVTGTTPSAGNATALRESYDRVVVLRVGPRDTDTGPKTAWPTHGRAVLELPVDSLASLRDQWERRAL